MHGADGPVASDGTGHFAVWSCKSHDCGGNQMTVFLQTPRLGPRRYAGVKRTKSGKVQDLWLSEGKTRPLAANACGYATKDPFAALKKLGGVK